jgi:predicted ATPase
MDLMRDAVSRADAADLIDAVIAHGGARLLITGDAGMGKSTLIEAAATRAAATGALILRASPSFAERHTTCGTSSAPWIRHPSTRSRTTTGSSST